MIAVNGFFNPVSMVSSEKQDVTFAQNSYNKSENKFRDVLDNSVKMRDSQRPVKKEMVSSNKEYQNSKNEVKKEETKTVESSPIEKGTSEKKVSQKESVNTKDNKENQNTELSQEDKAFVKEIADKLNVDSDTLLNLLQVLNIDLNSLKQGVKGSDEALAKINDSLDAAIGKLDIKLMVKDGEPKDKIHLLINIHNDMKAGMEDKSQEQNVQINLNIKTDNTQKQANVQKNDASSQEIEKVGTQDNIQPQIDMKVGVKEDTKKDETRQFKVENAQQPVLKASTKQNKDFKGTDDSNGQFQKEAQVAQTTKNGEKVEPSVISDNIKVINLKTSTKEAVSDTLKVDNQNTILPQKFETIGKTIPVKAVLQAAGQKDNIFGQIVENAKLILSDKQTEMEMNLKPENLGKLSIKIATENGFVMAKITTENQQVKAAIESNLQQFKEQLQQQGLNIQEFSVSVGQDSRRELFDSQRSNTKANKISGLSSVEVSENYAVKQMVRNPYLISQSSIDFTA